MPSAGRAIREDLRDVMAGLSQVRRLAEIKQITPHQAADLVAKELGWEGCRVSEEWRNRVIGQGNSPENNAYKIARAIADVADALGAPMTNDRLLESGA